MQKRSEHPFVKKLMQGLKDKNPDRMSMRESEIQQYINSKKWYIPDDIEGFDGLINILVEDYGGEYRNEGDGAIKERYIQIRKGEIPIEVRNEVEAIIIRLYSSQKEVSSSKLGQLFWERKINIEDYGYKFLTEFIREFSDLLQVDSKKRTDGQADITYIVNPVGMNRIMKRHGGRNKEVIKGYLEDGDYVELLEFLRKEEINLFLEKDIELWEMVLTAVAVVEEKKYGISCCQLFIDEEIRPIFANLSKDENYITLGRKIQEQCGCDSLLAYYVFQLGSSFVRSNNGKAAQQRGIRNARECYKEVLLYCAKYQDNAFEQLWMEYKELYYNEKWMNDLLYQLYMVNQYDNFMFIYHHYPSEYMNDRVAEVIKFYIEIIQGQAKANSWMEFAELPGDTAGIGVNLLSELFLQSRYEEFAEVLYTFISRYNKYIEKFVLDKYLAKYNDADVVKLQALLECGKKDYKCWCVINYLVQGGCLDSVKEEWLIYKEGFRETLFTKMNEEKDEIKKEVLKEEIIQFFPTDKAVIGDAYKKLIEELELLDEKERIRRCEDLIASRDIALLIMLYEKEELEISYTVSILEEIYRYYYESNNRGAVVKAKYNATVAARETKGFMVKLTELLVLLRELYHGNSVLDEALATQILIECCKYECGERDEICPDTRQMLRLGVNNYRLILISLAIEAKYFGLAALLYALLSEKKKSANNEFGDWIRGELLHYLGGKRKTYILGNLVNTFNYVLTVESIDTCIKYFNLMQNALTYENVQGTECYRNRAILELNAEDIVKTCIAHHGNKFAWIIYGNYTIKNKRIAKVNYVANVVC